MSVPSNPSTFTIISSNTTLDTLPPNSILVHSTNCFGEWGAGFALAVHERYPLADEVYIAHCDAQRPAANVWPDKDKLIGTCLLIPPQSGDGAREAQVVWIACLFTSYGYGRATKKHAAKDTKKGIVMQTEAALRDLRRQVEFFGVGGVGGDVEGLKSVTGEEKVKDGSTGKGEEAGQSGIVFYSPKFNSGSFGVEWEETEKITREIFKGWNGKWVLLSPGT